MVLDRREPAVYVTIEDASYVAPTIEIGRVTFGVTLCDRGPHNVLRPISSKAKFHQIYGQPNYKRTHQVHYQLDQALNYAPILICRVMPEDAALANVKIVKEGSETLVSHIYWFESGSNIVRSNNDEGVKAIVGDDYSQFGAWIYAEHDDKSVAGQVVDVNKDTNELILAQKYTGLTTADLGSPFDTNGANLFKYLPYIVESQDNVIKEQDLSDTDINTVFNFYSVGAGQYYNKLILKGYRNTQFERMYMKEVEVKDDDGKVVRTIMEVEYPYMFMDLALYELKDDGSERLLEGPWTVSLVPRLPTNEIIRDISSGRILFLENIINESSEYIRVKHSRGINELIDVADSASRRLQVMLLLSQDTPLGTKNKSNGVGLNFDKGSDGTGLYDAFGNLNPSDELLGRVAKAYKGDLESPDGSIEQVREYVYPYVLPDYIVSGGYPFFVQTEARWLAAIREDCIHLGDVRYTLGSGSSFTGDPLDSGYSTKVDTDLLMRQHWYSWNNWTSALYTQYRKVFDRYTGDYIWMSPVYHAIERHLFCDAKYFIAEPVAGIEKGNIAEGIELAYLANHTQRGDMQDQELNFTIQEPQGKYFLTQLSTWRRMSVLKRLHVGKFCAYLRKTIPPLLKDILQRKATKFWIEQARYRVHHFVSRFVENPSLERYSILKSFSVDVEFDEVRSELNVYLNITPIRAIERINVFIIVH